MLEFRKSLPAYKEKGALLTAISQNQVYTSSNIVLPCYYEPESGRGSAIFAKTRVFKFFPPN